MYSRMVVLPVYDAQLGLVFAAPWSGHVYAMDGRTGTIKWRFALPKAGNMGVGLASGPALANSTLFIADYAGRIIALDARNGKSRWVYQDYGSIVATPVVRLANSAE